MLGIKLKRIILVSSLATITLLAQQMDYNAQIKNKPGVLSDTSIYTSFSAACAAALASNLVLSINRTWTSVPTTNCTNTLEFNGGKLQPANGQTITFKVQSAPLATICDISLGGHCVINTSDGKVYPQWFGGTLNTHIQAASDSIPNGGEIHFIAGTYTFNGAVSNKYSYQTFMAEDGAIFVANSVPFGFSNGADSFGVPVSTIAISSAPQGGTVIALASSSGLTVGQRIVVSAGTFLNSGTEEGPIEFATIASIPDGGHITVQNPLEWNYGNFGLPSQSSPRVVVITTPSVHDIRWSGGTWTTGSTFNSCYGSFAFVENLEFDHINFVNMGNCLFTGGKLQRLNFHDNWTHGTAYTASLSGSGYQGFDISSTSHSVITHNHFNMAEIYNVPSGNTSNQYNHFNCEEACYGNVVDGNDFGPISNNSSGAITFFNNGFNNRIVNNHIWGLASDIASNLASIGIENVNGSLPSTQFGDVVSDNILTNVDICMYEFAEGSQISGNICANSSLNASSRGLTVGSNSSGLLYGHNAFTNVLFPYRTNSGGAPGTPSMVVCDGTGHTGCGSDNGAGTGGTIQFIGNPYDEQMYIYLISGTSTVANNKAFVVTFANPFGGQGTLCNMTAVNPATYGTYPLENAVVSPQGSYITSTFTGYSNSATALLAGQTFQWSVNCPRPNNISQ